LTELVLNRNGNKPELQNRLVAHYGLDSDKNNKVEIQEDNDEEEDLLLPYIQIRTYGLYKP